VGSDDIERAHGGDRTAMRTLLDYLLPVVRRAVLQYLRPIARARGRDPMSEVDDLVAGVFERLLRGDWRVLRAFDPTRGTLPAYVSGVAWNHVLGVFQARCRDPFAEVPMVDDELEARTLAVVDHEQQSWARRELDEFHAFLCERLDERGLMLFHMLEVDGRSVVEVCEHTQMSRDALYQWRARFRRIAREWRAAR
jgi:RNA polymerase sigma-70 factor (ECF subfamily)